MSGWKLPSAAKRGRRFGHPRYLRIEPLEPRELMSVTLYDQDLNGRDTAYFHRSVLPIGGLQPTDRVTAEISLRVGEKPPGPTRLEASLGGHSVTMAGGSRTIQFRTGGQVETLDVKIWNYDPGTLWWHLGDDMAHVKVYYDRQDLTAETPQLQSNGRLSYGARVTSPISVDVQGKSIGVELSYARYDKGQWVPLATIRGPANLRLGVGDRTEYSVGLNELPQPPSGATHIVSWVDRGRAITEQSFDNNAAAIGIDAVLPNFAATAPKRRDDGGIQFGCRVEQLPAIPSSQVSVDLYYAKGPTLNDILVKLDSRNVGDTPRSDQSFAWSSGKLAVPPPKGATHVLAVVDPANRVVETNENDNVAAVPLTSLLPNYHPSDRKWDKDGDLHVEYKVTDAPTPRNLHPQWAAFWASGQDLKDKLPGKSVASGFLDCRPGAHSQMIPFRKLHPPAGATHLLFIADHLQSSDETNESDNFRAIRVTPLKSIAGNLTVYRPQSPGLPAEPVTETDEDAAGAGVRVNSDDDNKNGVQDYRESGAAVAASPSEDDLIRLDVRTNYPSADPVEYVLRQVGTPAVRLWTDASKGKRVLSGAEAVVALAGNSGKTATFWVEWALPGHGEVQLQLLARDRDSGAEKLLDQVKLRSSQRYMLTEAWGGAWSDADKSVAGRDDDKMCWAATAANILQWTGWGLVGGMTTADQMFAYLQDHWTDKGGSAYYGLDWWFDGTNNKQGAKHAERWAQVNAAGGGFFPKVDFSKDVHTNFASGFLTSVKDFLNAGYGVGLSIERVIDPAKKEKAGHAVTCWGYEYLGNSASGYLGLWITDSDDNMGVPGANQLRYYHLKRTGNQWYLQDYAGRSDWRLAGVIGMARRPAGTLAPAVLSQPAGHGADVAPTLDGGFWAVAVAPTDLDPPGSSHLDSPATAQRTGLANGTDGTAAEFSRGVPWPQPLAGVRGVRDDAGRSPDGADFAQAVCESWWDGARGTLKRVQDDALLDLLADDQLGEPLWL